MLKHTGGASLRRRRRMAPKTAVVPIGKGWPIPECAALPGPSPPLATMQRALVRAPGAAAAAAGGGAPSRRRAVAARPATALLASSASSSASRAGRAAPAPGRAPAPTRRAGAGAMTLRSLSEAGMDGDLAAVRKVLASNAAQLAQPVPGVGARTSDALPAEEKQARMSALMDEERRLATLEAQLAGAERGLSASERELLQQLLARQRASAGGDMTAQTMKARLEATEAEAAVRGCARVWAHCARMRRGAAAANKPQKAVDARCRASAAAPPARRGCRCHPQPPTRPRIARARASQPPSRRATRPTPHSNTQKHTRSHTRHKPSSSSFIPQALRAIVTAGRANSGSLLEPMVLDRPTVRQVMDWNDVDWAALSGRERVQVWYDIIIGKTLDEWREEWALSKAEGFGLKGLSTLLLAATVIVCAAYSILALTTATGGGVLVRALRSLALALRACALACVWGAAR
jgi:hypothetical protein